MRFAVDNRSENAGRGLGGLHVLSTATNVSGDRSTHRGEGFLGGPQTIHSLKCQQSLSLSGVGRVIPVIPSPYGDDDREKVLTTITIGKAAV